MDETEKSRNMLVAVRLTGDLAEWFDTLIKQSGKGPSDVLKEILEEYRLLKAPRKAAPQDLGALSQLTEDLKQLAKELQQPNQPPISQDNRIPQLKYDRKKPTLSEEEDFQRKLDYLKQREAIKTAACQERAAIEERAGLSKRKRQPYRGAKVDWGNSEGINGFKIRDD